MKRVMLAIMSGLLLSCQGPAAVLAHEAAATARGVAPGNQYRRAADRPLSRKKPHGPHQDLPGDCAALAVHHDPR